MIPLAFIITAACVLAGSFIRFYLPPFWNKLLVCAATFLIAVVITNYDLDGLRFVAYGLFVLVASYSFSWYGTCSSLLLIVAAMSDGGEFQGYPLAGLLCVGIVGALFQRYKQRKQASEAEWLKQLYKQSRHLSILKEIGIAIQSTMEVEKLLHIILTAITAGYGLGFNRALLFLIDEKDSLLKGQVGIGSMNENDGISTWNRVVSRRMNLGDFIDLKQEAQFHDNKLINLLREIEIPLHSSNHIFHQALTERKPFIINQIDSTDSVQRLLAETFQMSSFAVVPMLIQGKMIGVIVVDNNVNHQPIDIEEIDSITPLAAQASVAIENSRLYERTQQLSITDGLTGLYNQRYYQEMLRKLVLEAEQGQPLSLIIVDIDSFKHYNDTNGHLEGNNALIGMAKIIMNAVNGIHIPFRFGGEEFIALIPNASPDEALRIAEEIRSEMEQHPFHNKKAQPSGRLTVSIGIASYQPGMSMQQLQDLADAALYEAKRNGRNRVIVHREGVALS
ncbi:MAG: diguanylate cyclase [Candidatus Pristimantibacillus sp.]